MRGKLIVLDGTDGSGKDTQTALLLESARRRRLSVAVIRYPSEGETFSGRFIREEYLTGKLGDLSACHPKLIFYLYAVDRYEQQTKLNELLETHDLVVANRYVVSGIAYQAAGLRKADRPAFRVWAEELDYDVMHNFHEDAVVFLSLPVALSNQLIAKRNKQQAVARDIHEEDSRFREEVLGEYETLCAMHKHWFTIKCNKGDQIRSIEDIASEINSLVFEKILVSTEVLV